MNLAPNEPSCVEPPRLTWRVVRQFRRRIGLDLLAGIYQLGRADLTGLPMAEVGRLGLQCLFGGCGGARGLLDLAEAADGGLPRPAETESDEERAVRCVLAFFPRRHQADGGTRADGEAWRDEDLHRLAAQSGAEAEAHSLRELVWRAQAAAESRPAGAYRPLSSGGRVEWRDFVLKQARKRRRP